MLNPVGESAPDLVRDVGPFCRRVLAARAVSAKAPPRQFVPHDSSSAATRGAGFEPATSRGKTTIRIILIRFLGAQEATSSTD